MALLSAIKTMAKNLVKGIVKLTKNSPITRVSAESFNTFNPAYATVLAQQQDALITAYGQGQYPSQAVITAMTQDPWVAVATKLAPSNLIIRQWCLLDLFNRNYANKDRIVAMINRLSVNGAIWLEGYSYWLYARMAIDPWATSLPAGPAAAVNSLIQGINLNFKRTAYLRSGVWYPLPMGDVRNDPLLDQTELPSANVLANWVLGDTVTYSRGNNYSNISYSVKSRLQGLNIHIPISDYTVNVYNGVALGFTFYTGLQNKYPTVQDLIRDTFDFRRVNSI